MVSLPGCGLAGPVAVARSRSRHPALPWLGPRHAAPERETLVGTAKYDHPGYIADLGDQGHYQIGLWCPHGYPAHIHIGRPGAPQSAALRLRIADSAFQSLSDDMETLCRRALGQAVAAGLLGASQPVFQETRFHPDAAPWQGPLSAVQLASAAPVA